MEIRDLIEDFKGIGEAKTITNNGSGADWVKGENCQKPLSARKLRPVKMCMIFHPNISRPKTLKSMGFIP